MSQNRSCRVRTSPTGAPPSATDAARGAAPAGAPRARAGGGGAERGRARARAERGEVERIPPNVFNFSGARAERGEEVERIPPSVFNVSGARAERGEVERISVNLGKGKQMLPNAR